MVLKSGIHQLRCHTSLSHYVQDLIHPRWCRIASINTMSRVISPSYPVHFRPFINRSYYTTPWKVTIVSKLAYFTYLYTGGEAKSTWGDLHNPVTTPWKINMEPENGPLEKENHLPNHHFQVPWTFQYKWLSWANYSDQPAGSSHSKNLAVCLFFLDQGSPPEKCRKH